ncbi:Mycophenolic acid acyl-glucuronide esterase, mitochondrial [Chionoecetes opilio]|uniref:Mycophenolic acid acyl-glucuronide esterase, mitochondrial n=1 Tax=Chionoecetes opilio TaxID=41210 RepID=A0A8J5D2K9_CHIOP|nr:Mycophenolic acid acyl-glucuronide esterase, mitochondrial [Chionoecetes opilio]
MSMNKLQCLASSLAASRRLLTTPRRPALRPPLRAFHVSTSEPETLFHEVKDGASGKVRRLAYHRVSGPRRHGLIYIPGFMAHKGGGKPLALHPFSQKYGFPYVRYDPSGLGESEGVKKTETRFSLWLEDAQEMLLNATDGPQIVVITCHLVQRHPEKFAGILMLAPGINFHSRYEKVLRSQLTPELLQKFEAGMYYRLLRRRVNEVRRPMIRCGAVSLYAPDYGEFPITKGHFEDMKKFALSREPDQIPVPVPVRIIHGVKDKDVPHTESLPLLHSLEGDVHLTFLKHAGHTLLDPASLEVIYDAILKLALEVDQGAK